ncbi:hypothetical protein NDU88_003029 [Pleurodeles waltl]|uniref:Uncharacterized protein n=1 Tax=Pleurodeles waltl TaxID=8319 RepID=A0AAV7PCM4_PLEWA|nr:hypothetical protein NDU88_003029 [Pleurodeles waltl]
MYRPPLYNTPIRQLFRGGTNAIKSTAETVLGRETTHISTLKEEPGRMEPELQVLPMLVYLLIYQEYQRRQRRPQ